MEPQGHPHIDPRQPRQGSQPGTNPPVFAWKPSPDQTTFRLLIARDADFTQVATDLPELAEPIYLPEAVFAPGRYFWRWESGGEQSEPFTFEITPDAVRLEIPPASDWLTRFAGGHPRIYVTPGQVADLRVRFAQSTSSTKDKLLADAARLLGESHHLAEPPFLPDINRDYEAWFAVWYEILWDSRAFVKGAETLALAYLLTGDVRFARAACERMASISQWDPDGSSEVNHNSEAHMSVIWNGPKACDWVWEHFTHDERTVVVAQFRRRGQNQFNQLRHQGYFGVTRFDSHSGRKIVFLAMTALVFHDEIPEAAGWLEWLRPILCGIWPIWAGDDGAWAEGISYATAYVEIMTMFATALKRGAGVNLYRRPFWRNHAIWRQYTFPPYAEWIGFGDHTERWAGTWITNADLVEQIARETGSADLAPYIAQVRAEAAVSPSVTERNLPGITSELLLVQLLDQDVAGLPQFGPEATQGYRDTRPSLHRVFAGAGWAAIRTNLADTARDVALIFRSSPYGAISHAHASNNDFFVHVAGRAMAMPSGYYDGYGSNHHAHWVWHTKSHNCVTLSDAPQIMRSHASVGAIEYPYEDERLVYWRGNADAAYADRAARCRRHVIFFKSGQAILMVDEFTEKPGMVSALQWNIHAWERFAVDEAARSFRLCRGESELHGHFLYHHNAFFTLTEGWDPPPQSAKSNAQWYMQYNLRFTTSGFGHRTLGVVLCPGHVQLPPATVTAQRIDNVEVAQIGANRVAIRQGETMMFEGQESEALIALAVDDRRYEVSVMGLIIR